MTEPQEGARRPVPVAQRIEGRERRLEALECAAELPVREVDLGERRPRESRGARVRGEAGEAERFRCVLARVREVVPAQIERAQRRERFCPPGGVVQALLDRERLLDDLAGAGRVLVGERGEAELGERAGGGPRVSSSR